MWYRLSIARGRRREKKKKECHVRPWRVIDRRRARRRASRGVYRGLSKVYASLDGALGQYRRMHASSPPAAGALCITDQRRRLTAASRIAINIETPRVGFSWTWRAKKKGVPWSRDHGERKKRARGWRFARARLSWRVTSGAPRGARSIADGSGVHEGCLGLATRIARASRGRVVLCSGARRCGVRAVAL